MKDSQPITIDVLFPQLSSEQQEAAAANLRQYLTVLSKIAERAGSEEVAVPVDEGG